MKKLLNVTGHIETPEPAIEPGVGYVHLYLEDVPVAGSSYSEEERARRGRSAVRGGGVMVKVTRNSDGDFFVDAVEEF